MIVIPEKVRKVISALRECGHEAYMVGGCVRDSLLGKEPGDYDVTTSANPDEMKRSLAGFKIIETGLKHGTLTVMSDGEPIEVTTYRLDGEYTDHRRPETVILTKELSEDLKRRDFTVNAMAFSEKDGLIDLFEGKKDLEAGIIRCVGDPEKRFGEDALRILRALRFSATLGFEIEKNTEEMNTNLSNP